MDAPKKVMLPKLPDTGLRWWQSLNTEGKRHYMWPRFEAGRLPAQIRNEFGFTRESAGIVSGQRNLWLFSKGKGPPSMTRSPRPRQLQVQRPPSMLLQISAPQKPAALADFESTPLPALAKQSLSSGLLLPRLNRDRCRMQTSISAGDAPRSLHRVRTCRSIPLRISRASCTTSRLPTHSFAPVFLLHRFDMW